MSAICRFGRLSGNNHFLMSLRPLRTISFAVIVIGACGRAPSASADVFVDEAEAMADRWDSGDQSISFDSYKTEHGDRGFRDSQCYTDMEDTEFSPTYGPVKYSCITTRLAHLPGDEIKKFKARSCRVGPDANAARFKAAAENQSAISAMETATAGYLGVPYGIFKTDREAERCTRLEDGPDKPQANGSTTNKLQSPPPLPKLPPVKPPRGVPAPSPSNVATFIMHNRDRYRLGLEFYSQTRSRAWPGGNMQYNIPRDDTYNLNCQPGEKICFGAWRDHQTTTWGVGRGSESCKHCCVVCGQTYETTLTDGGPDSFPQRQDNSGSSAASILNDILGAAIIAAPAIIQSQPSVQLRRQPTYVYRPKPPPSGSTVTGTP